MNTLDSTKHLYPTVKEEGW